MKTEHHCRLSQPMPKGTVVDPEKERWIHHDVTELEDLDMYGILFRCNACDLEFTDRC